MPKKKTKDWKSKNLSLSKDSILQLEELSKFENMNESEFVEFLLSNWDAGIHPESKLNNLLNKRKISLEKINLIENEISKCTKEIEVFNQLKKQKLKKKDEALDIIERLLVNNDLEIIDKVCKTWQKITGISAIELLIEAKERVEKKGV